MKLSPTEKKVTRDLIRRYCERCENVRWSKHYSQNRPMSHLGLSPSQEWSADCSGYVTGAFFWADKYTKFRVSDPNGYGYNTYGYTGSLLAHNKRHRVPLDRDFFFVGDIAIFGSSFWNTKHTTLCRKNGSASNSVWSSFGREAGPEPTRLFYRSDLLIVVRSEVLL